MWGWLLTEDRSLPCWLVVFLSTSTSWGQRTVYPLVVAAQDWGGSEGTARYPPDINVERRWPINNPGGQLITQEHDLWTLRRSLEGLAAKCAGWGGKRQRV